MPLRSDSTAWTCTARRAPTWRGCSLSASSLSCACCCWWASGSTSAASTWQRWGSGWTLLRYTHHTRRWWTCGAFWALFSPVHGAHHPDTPTRTHPSRVLAGAQNTTLCVSYHSLFIHFFAAPPPGSPCPVSRALRATHRLWPCSCHSTSRGQWSCSSCTPPCPYSTSTSRSRPPRCDAPSRTMCCCCSSSRAVCRCLGCGVR